MYLIPNSKIFFLLSYIFIWTPASHHRPLLRFLHLASPKQLLSTPCFYQLHNPSLNHRDSKSFSVLLNLLSSQSSSVYFNEFLFFLSNILVQTLLQIQPFPNVCRGILFGKILTDSVTMYILSLSYPTDWEVSRSQGPNHTLLYIYNTWHVLS